MQEQGRRGERKEGRREGRKGKRRRGRRERRKEGRVGGRKVIWLFSPSFLQSQSGAPTASTPSSKALGRK